MRVWYYEDSLPPHPFYTESDGWTSGRPPVEIPDEILRRHDAAWDEWQAACNALKYTARAAS